MLFLGDDWAEDHHDLEIQDETGQRLDRARPPEGAHGIAQLHALVREHGGEDLEPEQVVVGIETDRGPWVAALVTAGYTVYAVNPRQVARYRDRHSTSGAKSDAGDAHVLADMVRTDRHQLRPIRGDTAQAEGLKVLARAHQNLIWDRQRQLLRLRSALREYFPAALAAFDDLAAPDTLELLDAAPAPHTAAELSQSRIAGALQRARRRDVDAKAEQIQAVLCDEQLTQPAALATGYAAVVRAATAVIITLNSQISTLQSHLDEHFHQHPDGKIYRSQPGLGEILGARLLAEFGDDPDRFPGARARKNYAGSSPITRASGKRKIALARWVRNRRLTDALHQQAFSALTASPGARAYYDQLRARQIDHHAALRQLSNRLVGILHGCLKTRTLYDETTAWAHHTEDHQPAA